MKHLLVAASAILLSLGAATAGAAQGTEPDPAMVALAEQVLTASGNGATVGSVLRTSETRTIMRDALRRVLPAASDAALDAAVDGELSHERQAFFEENRRLYATMFSAAELKDMLAFYSSPGGKALVAHGPAITAEKMAFGRQLGSEAIVRMKAAVCAREACPAQ